MILLKFALMGFLAAQGPAQEDAVSQAITEANVSAEVREMLQSVARERGLADVRRAKALINSAVRSADPAETILQYDRTPPRYVLTSNAPLKGFQVSDQAHYQGVSVQPPSGPPRLLVYREGKPFDGLFEFLSLKRFDRLRNVVDTDVTSFKTCSVLLRQGEVAQAANPEPRMLAGYEVIAEEKLNSKATEVIKYFKVLGTDGFGRSDAVIAARNGLNEVPVDFQWGWNETRETFPGVGQVLVRGFQGSQGVPYLDVTEFVTLVFPVDFVVGDGLLELSLAGLLEDRLTGVYAVTRALDARLAEAFYLLEISQDPYGRPAGKLKRIRSNQLKILESAFGRSIFAVR